MPTRREELIAAALRAKVPVAALDPECKWVDSREQAAIDAFGNIPTGDKESAGAIYQNDKGEFCYSVPVPGGDRSFKFTLGKGDYDGRLKFDSIYHTHPDEGNHETGVSSDNFSPHDVEVAKKLGKPSFIRVERTGEVKAMDPAAVVVDRFNGGARGQSLSRRDDLVAAYDAITGKK